MGACASVPKAMRGEVTAAPPPEQPKVDTTVTTMAARAEEAKAEEVKVVVENDRSQSLGTLLVEEEAPEEPEGSSQAKTVPKYEIEEEEESSRPGPLTVSEPVDPVASQAEEKAVKPTV